VLINSCAIDVQIMEVILCDNNRSSQCQDIFVEQVFLIKSVSVIRYGELLIHLVIQDVIWVSCPTALQFVAAEYYTDITDIVICW
jgi:hypothetical protein